MRKESLMMIEQFNAVLATAPLEFPDQQGSFAQMMAMIAILAIPFYFLMWRPERQRRQLIEERRSSMKKGDRVYAMGIVGTVYRIQEETVVLKMIDGHQIEVLRSCITDVFSQGAPEEGSS
ncbi:MAG: hypothetical protein K0S07_172 [Chlamydiales bacterium]|jgi:preprotein translocase subunit YajC|nr:hypothetical protein [Chlamydiales bacterium]